MNDQRKTKEQLIQELGKMRRRITALEASEAERKRTEEALRASEERYRSLLNDVLGTSSVGIFILDSDFKVVWVNQSLERYFGLRRDEVIGKDKRQLIRERIKDIFADPERFAGKVFATYANNTYIEHFECHVLSGPEHEGRWLEHWSQPIRSGLYAGGRIEHYADITKRKKAEEALREAEEKYRVLAEANPASIFLVDHEGRYLYLNMACARLQRKKPADLIGKKLAEVFPEEQAKQLLEHVLHVFREDKAVQREDVISFGQASRYFATVLGPIHNTTGDVVSVIGIAQDITERKRAEEQLQAYAERLESLNAELRRSNRDLQEFTYTVSHDLQEPLRKIYTFAGFLLEDCGELLPQQGRQHLRHLQEGAARMKNLIRHLLALARVGARGAELVPVESRRVIKKALDGLSEKVRECGAEVTVEGELPVVMADAVQLGQVFQNLIGNALKFRSSDRAPKVTISACAQGDQVIFSVTDNGIGIEERFLERIFAIFQRLHPREEYEGAGVGLALCKKIVQRHGGRIWAESEVEKGSTFRLTLRTVPMTKEENP